jgi:hypothetical protein
MKTTLATTITNPLVALYDSLETKKVSLRQEADFIEQTQKEVKHFGNGHFSPVVETRGGTKTRRLSAKSRSNKPGRRSSEDLKVMMGDILGWMKTHPGSTSGAIGTALKISVADLALPIRKLIQGKQLKKKGQRSNTQYFAKGAKITQ